MQILQNLCVILEAQFKSVSKLIPLNLICKQAYSVLVSGLQGPSRVRCVIGLWHIPAHYQLCTPKSSPVNTTVPSVSIYLCSADPDKSTRAHHGTISKSIPLPQQITMDWLQSRHFDMSQLETLMTAVFHWRSCYCVRGSTVTGILNGAEPLLLLLRTPVFFWL